VTLPPKALEFAIETVLAVAEGADPASEFEYDDTYFEQGSDRTAARVIPLLLFPHAEVRTQVELPPQRRVVDAAYRLARAVANETRLHLARGLDHVWRTPCANGKCHHQLAVEIAIESARDCVLGDWDTSSQTRKIEYLRDPIDKAIARVAGDAIYVSRLDPAIRALAVGATSNVCVSAYAKRILLALVAGQRRGMLVNDAWDQRGSHALVTARALLTLAASGDDTALEEHIDEYADNGGLLSSFLNALSCAAEENESLAAVARRVWPRVIEQALELDRDGGTAFDDYHRGNAVLGALMPTRTPEWTYLYRELAATPVAWTDPIAWRAEIDAWVARAKGLPECVDSLIGLVADLAAHEQADAGLRWVAPIVFADVEACARRSWLLPTWLIEIRAAVSAENLSTWQDLVDALVVAGVDRLAPYSD
jgi:hypothetical protein